MTSQKTLLAMGGMLLFCLSIFGGITFYWLILDTTVPAVVSYQHLRFLNAEIKQRSDLPKYEIRSAQSGRIVYRYLEYCVDRDIVGAIRGRWVNGVITLLPDLATIGVKGCYQRTLALRVPDVLHVTKMRYVQTAYYTVNPMRTNTLTLIPMELEVYP